MTISTTVDEIFLVPLYNECPLFAPYEEKISNIDNQSCGLTKDKNRILTIDGICKKKS
jgi:hypothetical protein